MPPPACHLSLDFAYCVCVFLPSKFFYVVRFINICVIAYADVCVHVRVCVPVCVLVCVCARMRALCQFSSPENLSSAPGRWPGPLSVDRDCASFASQRRSARCPRAAGAQ